MLEKLRGSQQIYHNIKEKDLILVWRVYEFVNYRFAQTLYRGNGTRPGVRVCELVLNEACPVCRHHGCWVTAAYCARGPGTGRIYWGQRARPEVTEICRTGPAQQSILQGHATVTHSLDDISRLATISNRGDRTGQTFELLSVLYLRYEEEHMLPYPHYEEAVCSR